MEILVRVKPGSSQEKIVQTEEGLTVFLRAKAHDGEANRRLIEILSKHFKAPKTSIIIKRGQKSKLKLVSCENVAEKS